MAYPTEREIIIEAAVAHANGILLTCMYEYIARIIPEIVWC